MTMLELRSVSKAYGQGPAEVHAPREVSLSVGAGAALSRMSRGEKARPGREPATGALPPGGP